MCFMSICIKFTRRYDSGRLLLIALLFLLGYSSSHANPLTSFERALMPGPVIEGHAKYENDCTNCHKAFKKSFQNDLCLDCHKKVRADVEGKKGFHGRIKSIETRSCKVCHTEHKGRDADVVLLDKATFNHDLTDFKLLDSHTLVLCENCHKPKKKYREAKSKCIDCHKRDEPHKGKLGKKCEICHNVTRWSAFVFDHSKTDFQLKGRHVAVGCGDCHVAERYKGIPKKCYACHRTDDKHRGRYGQKCESCHVEKEWRGIKFDHDKNTDFKLKGRHLVVSCGQCHKGKDLYKENLKTECYACHEFKDEHKGRYGKKCEDCHSEKSWTELAFDHEKDTDYPLRGKHEEVACVDCHSGDLYEDETPTDCFSCHRHDDVHDGQQGKECDECHNEKGWIEGVAFDHDLTKFPLLGAHATVACEECHTTTNFKDAEIPCINCHEQDDIHRQRLTPHCSQCHNSVDWKLWEFDHEKQADFPLDGAHGEIHCEECHNEEIDDKIDMASTCFSCHAKDDPHNGSYGRVCERCHHSESFKDFSPTWRR